jgi:transcriptional regulator
MSSKKSTDNNVTHLDKRRIEKLERNSSYFPLLEEFDTLRAKLIYNKRMSSDEAVRLVTLVKYFLKHAHNEAFRIHVEHIYDKYIKEYEL